MNIKIWAYLAIIVAVIGFGKWAHSAIYDAGWNAAIVEQEELIQDAREQATKEARTKWQKLVDEAEGQIVIEEKIVEVIREIEKEIPVVVEKIVTVKPACADLGPDFAELFNAQVRSGSSGEVDSAGTTTNPDP